MLFLLLDDYPASRAVVPGTQEVFNSYLLSELMNGPITCESKGLPRDREMCMTQSFLYQSVNSVYIIPTTYALSCVETALQFK